MDDMILHSVLISYNRLDFTIQAVESYLATVTLPHTLVVVDNGSDEETMEWLMADGHPRGFQVLPLFENKYPGFACNRGFEQVPLNCTHLHRADNDFIFLPGWCDHVIESFEANPRLGQLGLRTDEEEGWNTINVGGNMVLRRGLWEEGLRYDERPWTAYREGWSEDGLMSPSVSRRGWEWERVKEPCIQALAVGDLNDPYYQKSYRDRGII